MDKEETLVKLFDDNPHETLKAMLFKFIINNNLSYSVEEGQIRSQELCLKAIELLISLL